MKLATNLLCAAGLAVIGSFSGGPLAAAELVLIEQPGCVYCAEWDREISAIYPKTPEGAFAPLRRMQLVESRRTDTVSFARPVIYTPTFVLIEEDRELARIEGYPGEDFFWGLLRMMLEKNTIYQGENG
jgi:hypothetical protein